MTDYQKWDYVTKERFSSYYLQVGEVMHFDPLEVLEIGVGAGVVRDILQGQGVAVRSLDVASSLKPDVTASVTHLPFCNRQWDMTICCEVLEHVPFAAALQGLREIRRVTRRCMLISVPNSEPYASIEVALPFLPKWRVFLPNLRWLQKPYRAMSADHCWELGHGEITAANFKQDLETAAGWTCLRDFRNPRCPYHHFFVLERI